MKIQEIAWMLLALALPAAAEELPFQSLESRLHQTGTAKQYWQTRKNPAERRRAFRVVLEQKKDFESHAVAGMKDPDPFIRRYALQKYFIRYGDQAVPEMKRMAAEKDPETAEYLLWCVQYVRDNKLKMETLKLLAAKSPVAGVRNRARRLSSFHFYRNNVRLQDNPTWDYDVVKIKSIPLPETGWKFRLDPWENGQDKGWFRPDFNDRHWNALRVNTSWERQGYYGYDGVAWYRIKFTMPKRPDCNAVELAFGAVDESAWVWLNGIYIGQHDIGLKGWDKPFWLDVTREIRWESENVLVVRVEDNVAVGGIWKPVAVDILK